MTEKDRQLLIENAEDGNPEAQFQLGIAYYNGDGINKNYREAYHWFLKASEQGIHEAQYWISKMMKVHVLIDTERYPMVIKRENTYNITLLKNDIDNAKEKLNEAIKDGVFGKNKTIIE